ncbi:hypothetical protein MKK67_12015 [Methylobacterium sp. J-072]|uniref:hypothetical protein n=1 Tax=Methylobacterium sp. J-072 TaxID=2836651 RepID=UPI001FBB9302|nr:hypothetical protein [Methylobacterium sp. J-072]MCJ2093209.1 hypothetical protein [Methylobacterium sp. J-072]
MSDYQDRLSSTIIARMREISGVNYVKSPDNLTEDQQNLAATMAYKASVERDRRLAGTSTRGSRWPNSMPKEHVYAWAMDPTADVHEDLLESMVSYGAADRPRLPGVTLADVEERIRFVNGVLADHLEGIKAQKTERGPAR